MSHDITMPGPRLSLIEDALYEITCISKTVKSLDHNKEEFPIILPGLMSRIQDLSEAVTTLNMSSTLEVDAASAWQTIRCERPSAKQIASVLAEVPNA